MEELVNRKKYGPEIAGKIEEMGSLAIAVANRWIMGWPARINALLMAEVYLDCLMTQVGQEKIVLANEADLRHLAPREILQMYEIREAPPTIEGKRDDCIEPNG